MRIGVIGTGGMGARHARNIARHVKGATVTLVMDAEEDRAASVAAEVGADVAPEARGVILSSYVDALVVASPDATHAGLAIDCIDAGKPALVEKPLGVSGEDAHGVVLAEVAAGRRLVQVGLMREFDPQHIAVRQSITAGDIGRPLIFRGWHRNPPQKPRPTTNQVVFGSAVHDIHSARWLLDSDPVRVFASGVVIHPSATQALELQLITLEMANGALATIEVNADSGFGYEVGVEVIGSTGTVTVAPHHTPVVRKGGTAGQRMEPDWLERFETAYLNEVRAWIASVNTGRAVGASAWDGYVALLAADGVVESLDTGMPVAVDLPRRPALYSDRSQ